MSILYLETIERNDRKLNQLFVGASLGRWMILLVNRAGNRTETGAGAPINYGPRYCVVGSPALGLVGMAGIALKWYHVGWLLRREGIPVTCSFDGSKISGFIGSCRFP